jgi:hypothetical protein
MIRDMSIFLTHELQQILHLEILKLYSSIFAKGSYELKQCPIHNKYV